MTLFDFEATSIDGEAIRFDRYRGKVALVVNVASKCGFTPQYAALEKLSRERSEAGLVVLGFPCNQFLWQEPGNDREIGQFCKLQYGVTFPMFARIDVNGKNAHPLYRWLKDRAPGTLGTKSIKWNFAKFLVGRDGTRVKRYGTLTSPESMTADLDALLASPG